MVAAWMKSFRPADSGVGRLLSMNAGSWGTAKRRPGRGALPPTLAPRPGLGAGGGAPAPAAPPPRAETPTATAASPAPGRPVLQAYPVPAGSRPHDVAPAAAGGGRGPRHGPRRRP